MISFRIRGGGGLGLRCNLGSLRAADIAVIHQQSLRFTLFKPRQTRRSLTRTKLANQKTAAKKAKASDARQRVHWLGRCWMPFHANAEPQSVLCSQLSSTAKAANQAADSRKSAR